MTVRRFDLAPLRKTKKTRDGMLRGEAHVTRVGVFVYRDAKGNERREFRSPEEVFKTDSIDSLKLVPMTLGHPLTGFVDAKTAKELQIGHIGSVSIDGQKIRADFCVTDSSAVDSVESGETQELSCGYTCRVDAEEGIWNGQKYTHVQRDIDYNHVAAVKRGRAGSEYRINLDSEDALCVEQPRDDAQGNDEMKTIKVDGVEYDATNNAVALQAAIDRLQTRTDSAEKASKEANAEKDKIQARVDAAEDKVKKAEEKSSDKAIAERVKTRAKLINDADDMVDDDDVAAKFDDMSDREIKIAVIKARQPDVKLDGKSDDYINARFDTAVEDFEAEEDDDQLDGGVRADGADDGNEDDDKPPRRNDSSLRGVRRAAANAGNGRQPRNDSTSAQEKMVQRNLNAWQRGDEADQDD